MTKRFDRVSWEDVLNEATEGPGPTALMNTQREAFLRYEIDRALAHAVARLEDCREAAKAGGMKGMRRALEMHAAYESDMARADALAQEADKLAALARVTRVAQAAQAEADERRDAAIRWTQEAHARNTAAIPLESQQTAVVESSGPGERAAREAFAQEHPEAELLSVHERSDRETWLARGRVSQYAPEHRRPTELDYEVALAAAKALCFTREGDDGPVSTWREFTAYVDEVLKERTLKREK